MIGRLDRLHIALPLDIDPSRLKEVQVSWAQVHHLQPELEDPSFTGRAEAVTLLSFLDYLNSLTRVAHTFMAAQLPQEVQEHFFVAILKPRLESDEENELLLDLKEISSHKQSQA